MKVGLIKWHWISLLHQLIKDSWTRALSFLLEHKIMIQTMNSVLRVVLNFKISNMEKMYLFRTLMAWVIMWYIHFSKAVATKFTNIDDLNLKKISLISIRGHPTLFGFLHSNVFYIWKQDGFIITNAYHLIWNISWCQLTLFLSSKFILSWQAVFHYFF